MLPIEETNRAKSKNPVEISGGAFENDNNFYIQESFSQFLLKK